MGSEGRKPRPIKKPRNIDEITGRDQGRRPPDAPGGSAGRSAAFRLFSRHFGPGPRM